MLSKEHQELWERVQKEGVWFLISDGGPAHISYAEPQFLSLYDGMIDVEDTCCLMFEHYGLSWAFTKEEMERAREEMEHVRLHQPIRKS